VRWCMAARRLEAGQNFLEVVPAGHDGNSG
jgi:hypothetical protein